MTYQARVIEGGKIVIPAELRRNLGIGAGDRLVVEQDGNAIVIKTFAEVIRESQRAFRKLVGPDFTVDQFLAHRRAEAAKE